jgi:hypothetical protein
VRGALGTPLRTGPPVGDTTVCARIGDVVTGWAERDGGAGATGGRPDATPEPRGGTGGIACERPGMGGGRLTGGTAVDIGGRGGPGGLAWGTEPAGTTGTGVDARDGGTVGGLGMTGGIVGGLGPTGGLVPV